MPPLLFPRAAMPPAPRAAWPRVPGAAAWPPHSEVHSGAHERASVV